MADWNFPNSPNVGDKYSFDVKTWVWNGSAWDLLTVSDSVLEQVQESLEEMENILPIFSETPPVAPIHPGQTWVNTTTGRKFLWVTDEDSSQWVEVEASFVIDNVNLVDKFKTELSSSNGSDLIGYKYGTVDTVITWLTPEAFGAVGDGIADDTNAVIAAANICLEKNIPLGGSGSYLLTDTVNLRKIAIEMPSAQFSINHAGIGIILGSSSSNESSLPQKIGRIVRVGGLTSVPTVRIIGAKGQNITVERSDYIQLYADKTPSVLSTDGSIAYSKFTFTRCLTVELANNLSASGETGVQWINENDFYLSRTRNLIITGDYSHNHNRFYGGAFENGSTIDVQIGNSNLFFNTRFEGGANINFGSGTWGNIVIPTWANNGLAPYQDGSQIGSVNINDLGVGNYVQALWTIAQREYPILDINHITCKSYSESTNDRPTIEGVQLQCDGIDTFKRASSTSIYQSPLIPVAIGDAIHLRSDALLRYRFRIYDENRKLITSTNDPEIDIRTYIVAPTSLVWNSSGNYFNNGTDQNYQVMGIRSNTIKYVSFQIISGTSVSGMRNLSATLITGSKNTIRRSESNFMRPRPALCASLPTRGFAKLGEKVASLTSDWYTNIFELDTNLTATISSGNNIVTGTGLTGILIGDVIGIILDNGSTHWTTVATNSTSTSFTINDPVPSVASNGNRFVINRWITT